MKSVIGTNISGATQTQQLFVNMRRSLATYGMSGGPTHKERNVYSAKHVTCQVRERSRNRCGEHNVILQLWIGVPEPWCYVGITVALKRGR